MNDTNDSNFDGLENMTWERWQRLSSRERDQRRDLSDLSPQLTGWEDWRVEVITDYGEKRRFIVGRSTGWRPIHIELANWRSSGGVGADKHYASVQVIEKLIKKVR